ncbi:MAG TPA: PhoH family protein [Candidatus Pacearchaeota archaeon]|nr:PhoH family protein [Candidatus Parcubacteria bacterium]HNZ83971.1 PhoH family protein [Candidatus Pacearchaeota archaeon]HPM08475.1 PhoH family protein [Candidatus Pacearchaeota archaeon]
MIEESKEESKIATLEMGNGKNGKKVFVGYTFNSFEEAFKFLEKKEKKEIIIKVKNEEDFNALRKSFFNNRDIIKKEELAFWVESIEGLDGLPNNSEISIKYQDKKIDALLKYKKDHEESFYDYGIKAQENEVSIRRLVSKPGEILHFYLTKTHFQNLKHLCSGKENTTFSLDSVIRGMEDYDAHIMFNDLYANAPCIFHSPNGDKLLAYYKSESKVFRRVRSPQPSDNILEAIPEKGELVSQNDYQAFYYAFMKSDTITCVFAEGSAGSGKTIMALNAAINCHKQTEIVRIFRPTTESGKEIGFLKGDLEQKIGPYSLIVSDLMYKVLRLSRDEYPLEITELPIFSENGYNQKKNGNGNEQEKTKKSLMVKKKVIIDIVNYIQGRNLLNETVIIDETQNLSDNDIETVLSRILGFSKIVLLWDPRRFQRKLVNPNDKGPSYYAKRMAGHEDVACIKLPKCVRNPFVTEMLDEVA